MAQKIINVNFDDLGTLAEALEEQIDDVQGELAGMADDIDKRGEKWAGPNRESFMAYFDERYNVLPSYISWLRSYAEAVDKAKTLYEELQVNPEMMLWELG